MHRTQNMYEEIFMDQPMYMGLGELEQRRMDIQVSKEHHTPMWVKMWQDEIDIVYNIEPSYPTSNEDKYLMYRTGMF